MTLRSPRQVEQRFAHRPIDQVIILHGSVMSSAQNPPKKKLQTITPPRQKAPTPTPLSWMLKRSQKACCRHPDTKLFASSEILDQKGGSKDTSQRSKGYGFDGFDGFPFFPLAASKTKVAPGRLSLWPRAARCARKPAFSYFWHA